MAGDYLELPSEAPVESDHHLSCLDHPSIHHGVDGSDADAVGTRNSAEAREGFQSLPVRGHRNYLSLERPTYHRC